MAVIRLIYVLGDLWFPKNEFFMFPTISAQNNGTKLLEMAFRKIQLYREECAVLN